ncbi:glycosyltransferase family 2 protein [Rhodobacter sp. SY28-1]|uniref:glycosyltransferase family 2 protein n=1 Tax=Rhodobacter sp. SY28-1 TaxID=2562317 RepID=UPI0010BF6CDF|nr:glycosyltransferase family 2 protein [Rhodobacter sp. SY28-1]
MQNDNDMGRKHDVLPPFASDLGEALRVAAVDYGDLLALIDRAEAGGADDWLQWADREAAKRYPKDMELVARWMLHETIRGQTGIVRTLRAVLSSLSENERRKPGILDALVRADFLLGQCDAGAERLAELAAFAPGYDATRAEAAQLRGLVAAGRVDEALVLARGKDGVNSPDLAKAMVETFQAASAHAELCAHVEAAGGITSVTDAPLAASYLSALEALGRLDDCLARGTAFLERVPASPSVVQLIRYVAIRLDRLAEVTPWLSRCASALEGRPEAVELRALKALDADDYAAAWAQQAKLGDQAGEAACRLRLGIATTDPSCPRRVALRAYRDYRALGVGHAGPEMQFGSYLLNAARRRSDLTDALAVVRTGLPHAKGNPYFHRLFLSLLVACGRAEEAKAHLAVLPEGLRTSRLVREVELGFRQAEGDHSGVRQAWADHARQGGYRVFSAETTAAVPVQPGREPKGRVVVFALVFNGIDYVQPFLDHYRKLGVEGFVMVDNGSTDGTREALAAAPDVVLYDQPGSFRASAHGVAWINPLIQQHALGRWALFVDIDEHLVFPGSGQGRKLADLVAYAEARGAGCFPSYMLDLFASPGSATEGFAGHRYFDREYVSFPSVLPPYRVVQGGVRGRLTGRQFLITKSPLVRVDADVVFLENNHLHTHLPPCDVTTALLHYKFVGDAKARFVEAVERGEHFLGGRFYRDMLARLQGNGIRRGLWTRTYRGDRQLTRMGLLTTAPDWDAWKGTGRE